ncbi:hypothetical protein HID58_095787 [Brassica napus]|uniref:TLC domain-containing protein n=1 Tax=Brassica napus TaxID=3708 RepID=A0ABQ7X2D0_BRANA|nr:hypothetical protein HID58_095787 [Brassica napus]
MNLKDVKFESKRKPFTTKDQELEQSWTSSLTRVMQRVLLTLSISRSVSSIHFCSCWNLSLQDVIQLNSYQIILSSHKMKRTEWNNRGISTLHAIFISLMALYFVFFSDLFSDQRSLQALYSSISSFGLGVSVGYFLADLGMIIWLYPTLGGSEYIFHHCLSGVAVAYSLFSGEAQLTHIWFYSLRWYLDISCLKRSKAYLINGVAIFLAWLTARILLFVNMFYHVYVHYDQVAMMHPFGYLLVFVVPVALSVMNLMWFGKIVKGLMKTLEKKDNKE